MRKVSFSEKLVQTREIFDCYDHPDDDQKQEEDDDKTHRRRRLLWGEGKQHKVILTLALLSCCCVGLLWTRRQTTPLSSSPYSQLHHGGWNQRGTPALQSSSSSAELLESVAERLQEQEQQHQLRQQGHSGGGPMDQLFDLNRHQEAAGKGNQNDNDGDYTTSPLMSRYRQTVRDFTTHLAETYLSLYHILDDINALIQNNAPSSSSQRWTQPILLPPLPGANNATDRSRHEQMLEVQKMMAQSVEQDGTWFWTFRQKLPRMAWEDHYEELLAAGTDPGPEVDYTDPNKYTYRPTELVPPESGYPRLKSYRELMDNWPQDEDFHGPIHEELMRFDYSNPIHVQASQKYIELELPFKLYNVPEVDEASVKWTDEYLSEQFDVDRNPAQLLGFPQESPNNFFVFFTSWDIHTFGVPPVRNNDLPYSTWAKHARYAEMARLPPGNPHFYYQAGDYKQTRYSDENSFIGRDLPSFGSRDNTYFVFNVTGQWGIQCRMGERGTVAATHQDPGRNMVAMVTGAKRYVLHPPNQCSNLGIFPQPNSPLHRHSAINFGHLNHLDDPHAGMSAKERAWLERAAASRAVETVLKAGEVLYIPSHWFHYIISVQKSTQCNCRSGIELEGRPEFGGRRDVITCGQDWGLTDVYAPDWVNEMKIEDITNRDKGRTW